MAIATVKGRNALASKYAQDVTHIALCVSDPGSGDNVNGEVTGGAYARQPITWSAPVDGVITGVVTFNVPAGVELNYSAACTGLTGANLYDKGSVPKQAFGTDGTYTLTVVYKQE